MASSATSYRDSVNDSARALITHAALHTADPGNTGASPSAGARAAISWVDNNNGTATGTASITVPAGETVTHFGLWSAATAGVFRTGGSLPAPQEFPTGGTYDLTITLSITDAP